jgi:general secretion pathway protein K
LILVMITIIALTGLVAGFAIAMNTEVRLARNADYDTELQWMGLSGIELARFALDPVNRCPEERQYDALDQFWAGGSSPLCSNWAPAISLDHVPLGRGTVSVKIIDAERKWNINYIATRRRDVLQQALMVIGVTDAGLDSTIEDSLADWCSPATSAAGFSGAKDSYYLQLEVPYYCKSGPIDDLSELLLVKGIKEAPDIYWGPHSTNHPVSAFQQHGGGGFEQVSTGRAGGFRNGEAPDFPVGLVDLFSIMGGPLNVDTADKWAYLLIPGMDEARADQLLSQRNEAPFRSVQEFMFALDGGTLGGGQGAPPGGTPALQPGQPGPGPQGLAGLVDVHSLTFEVSVTPEINGYAPYHFHGIIQRFGQQFKCVKFYWEYPQDDLK